MFLRRFSMKKGTLTYLLGPEKPSWVLVIISLSKMNPVGPHQWDLEAEGVGTALLQRWPGWLITAGSWPLLTSG